jgi:hypothetical protein
MVKMGQSKKYEENFSASSVAEVTTSLKSARLRTTWRGKWERGKLGDAVRLRLRQEGAGDTGVADACGR